MEIESFLKPHPITISINIGVTNNYKVNERLTTFESWIQFETIIANGQISIATARKQSGVNKDQNDLWVFFLLLVEAYEVLARVEWLFPLRHSSWKIFNLTIRFFLDRKAMFLISTKGSMIKTILPWGQAILKKQEMIRILNLVIYL